MPQRPQPDPASHLPLTPAAFYALLALADGEKHAYAMLKEVHRQTGGRVHLSASTLYSLVQRLEAVGLIVESAERPDPALDDQRRRYYRLSDLGRAVAQAEAERLDDALEVARDKRLLARRRPAAEGTR